MDRARQAQPAGRRVTVRGVARRAERRPARNLDAITAFEGPARDHCVSASGGRRCPSRPGCRPRRASSDSARGSSARVVEVDHPLLRLGPQRSGPIGTITTPVPTCGERNQRSSTSSSPSSGEKSAVAWIVAASAEHAEALVVDARAGPGPCGPRRRRSRTAQRTRYSRRSSRSRISAATPVLILRRARSARGRSGSRPGESSSARSPQHRLQADLGQVHLVRTRSPRAQFSSAPPAPQHSSSPDRAAVALAAGDARVEGRRGHRLRRRAAPLDLPAAPTSSRISIARMFSTCAFGSSRSSAAR